MCFSPTNDQRDAVGRGGYVFKGIEFFEPVRLVRQNPAQDVPGPVALELGNAVHIAKQFFTHRPGEALDRF